MSTRSFDRTVLDLLQFGTIRAVAEYLRVSWRLVKDMRRDALGGTVTKNGQRPRLRREYGGEYLG